MKTSRNGVWLGEVGPWVMLAASDSVSLLHFLLLPSFPPPSSSFFLLLPFFPPSLSPFPISPSPSPNSSLSPLPISQDGDSVTPYNPFPTTMVPEQVRLRERDDLPEATRKDKLPSLLCFCQGFVHHNEEVTNSLQELWGESVPVLLQALWVFLMCTQI